METTAKLSLEKTKDGFLVWALMADGSLLSLEFPTIEQVQAYVAAHTRQTLDEMVAAFLAEHLVSDPVLSSKVDPTDYTFLKGIEK